ncbi:MAG: hypothetical protein A4E61_01273 [Syntrophorhabdus sp. PtaB.Bin184]|nr:MAG: hypothetical protein A4E61_01273 [Syntrophorhabdus sp. PtaB.Bin184]
MKKGRVTVYPAVADGVDLPDLAFLKNADGDAFVPSTPVEGLLSGRSAAVAERVKSVDGPRLNVLLAPVLPECAGSTVTVTITGRRAPLARITRKGPVIAVEAHWNLFVPYFDHIKSLPVVHPEILDAFAMGVFLYMALTMKHGGTAGDGSRDRVIDAYREEPELLLASLDIFNKPTIYHIRPTRVWLSRVFAANDAYRLEIDISEAADAPFVGPEYLDELAGFIHKVVKNYAFRYGDYLWTQRYRITFGARSGQGMVTFEGRDIAINIHPLIYQSDWKPVVYLSLGYAIMLVMLRSPAGGSEEKCMHLALTKTWNRYLSFDESSEQPGVRELFGFSSSTTEQECRSLSECMVGGEDRGRVDDFIMLQYRSARERFPEKPEAPDEGHTGEAARFERLSNSIRELNTTLMRNNINHGKLIEILRSDGFDHLRLAEFLRTGRLDNRCVVDVSEWLLLRTFLYDLINAPKVFKNDYKMLLKVLTKVNKSLLVYIWTMGREKDPRFEMVSAYISKVMHDIFVFDRVKIYEIVSDPVECLEAEAVTGYLLNWAGFTPETRRSIIGILSGLPDHVVQELRVKTTDDVDRMVRVMGTRASGLIGFCLHQAYRWGDAEDELTGRIRSHFPELLRQAQKAMRPGEMIRGGAMLLLLLAEITSDERDGFAGNIAITGEERQTVRDLIKQCVDWDQRHFVMMVAGMAAGYMGSIDGWVLQQFDRLLARYDGGDRVMLRSVVQFDVDKLIERALMTAKDGEERTLPGKIQLLRFGVDPVISDEANRCLTSRALSLGIHPAEVDAGKRDIRDFLVALSRRMKEQARHPAAY